MKMVLIAFATAIVVASLAPLSAQAAGEKACFKNCRSTLVASGKWNSYPRGYCRQKCNYYQSGAASVGNGGLRGTVGFNR